MATSRAVATSHGIAVPAPGRRRIGGDPMTAQLGDPGAAFITNGHKNLFVSTCNLCGFGVFQTQEWEYSTGIVLGICHTECLEAQAKGGAR